MWRWIMFTFQTFLLFQHMWKINNNNILKKESKDKNKKNHQE
jgi:hypothetical protein